MARVKRAQVTTMETPAKPATHAEADKKNGHGNGKAALDLESAVRYRAYELYEKRGRQDGLALQDWIQAEAELRSQIGRTA